MNYKLWLKNFLFPSKSIGDTIHSLGGVQSIIAGNNITLSPSDGKGHVEVSFTALTDKSIPYWDDNAGALVEDNSQLNWDDTTKTITTGETIETTSSKVAPTFGSDIILDGGLEDWIISGQTLDSWSIFQSSNGTVTQVTGVSGFAAELTSTSMSGPIGLFQVASGLTPADTFDFSVDTNSGINTPVLLTNDDPATATEAYNFTGASAGAWTALSGPPTSDQILTIAASFGWVTTSLSGIPAPSNGQITPVFIAGNSGDSVDIDNVSLLSTAVTLSDWSETSGGDGTVTRVAGNSSAYAAELTNTSGNIFGIFETISVTPSTNYDLSIDYKSPTPTDGVLFLLDAWPPAGGTNAYNFTGASAGTWTPLSGPPNSDQTIVLSSTTSWQTETVSNIPGPANGTINAIFGNTTNGYILDIDNASLMLSSGGPELFTNANFETWSSPVQEIVNGDMGAWTITGSSLQFWTETPPGGGTGTLVQETDPTHVYRGTYSAHFTLDPSDGSGYGLSQNKTGLNTGDLYTLFFAAEKASGDDSGTNAVYFILDDDISSATEVWNWQNLQWNPFVGLNTLVSEQYVIENLNTTFGAFVTQQFPVPASGNLCPVFTSKADSGTHNMWLDAVKLEPTTLGPAISYFNFTNPSTFAFQNLSSIDKIFDMNVGGQSLLDLDGTGKFNTLFPSFDFSTKQTLVPDPTGPFSAVNLQTLEGVAPLPSQTGNVDRFLKTDGSSASWQKPDLASSDFVNQGTTTTVLHGNVSGNPSWAAVDLAADVTGVTPVVNGGTGANNSTSALSNLGAQTHSAELDGLSTSSANGFEVRTGTGTYAQRTLQEGAAIAISYPDGVSNNPVIAVINSDLDINGMGNYPLTVANSGTGANTAAGARTNLGVAIGSDVEAWSAELDGVAALAATGLVARTATGTYAARTISAGVGISVSNGGGVANNPSVRSIGSKGLNLASANNLTIVNDGYFVFVTGTTQINLIDKTGIEDGAVFYLQFQSALTVKHNQTPSGSYAPILISGSSDYLSAAGSIAMVIFDGTNFNLSPIFTL